MSDNSLLTQLTEQAEMIAATSAMLDQAHVLKDSVDRMVEKAAERHKQEMEKYNSIHLQWRNSFKRVPNQ